MLISPQEHTQKKNETICPLQNMYGWRVKNVKNGINNFKEKDGKNQFHRKKFLSNEPLEMLFCHVAADLKII